MQVMGQIFETDAEVCSRSTICGLIAYHGAGVSTAVMLIQVSTLTKLGETNLADVRSELFVDSLLVSTQLSPFGKGSRAILALKWTHAIVNNADMSIGVAFGLKS